jgi:hypothetical protein
MTVKRPQTVLNKPYSLKGFTKRFRRVPVAASLNNSRQGERLDRELQAARELALQLGWSLRRSEERLDSALQRIDSTLRELEIQKEQVRTLEHRLGIER